MNIVKRFPVNPILTPDRISPGDQSMQVECLLNPGAFKFEGKTWLLVRVAERPKQESSKTTVPIYTAEGVLEPIIFDNEDPKFNNNDKRVFEYDGVHYLSTLSHLRLFSSTDGFDFIEDKRYQPLRPMGEQETYGIEDCRVTQIRDIYYLTYTKVSPYGVGVGLMTTKDWKVFDRKGMILPPHNKDCTLFEEKINGKYYALHRPSSPELGGNYIWLASSPDLEHWGHHQCIATTRKGYWDSARIGAGAAPIRTREGWLEIYHGANEENRYCLGALLLDSDDPSKVVARSKEPLMEPTMDYEKTGFFGNVVFTNGHLVDGDTITIYYGSSDEVICGGTLSINETLKTLKESKQA